MGGRHAGFEAGGSRDAGLDGGAGWQAGPDADWPSGADLDAAARTGLEAGWPTAGAGAAVGVRTAVGARGAGVPPAQTRGSEPSVRTRMMMRPYARTGGRTRPDYELALEALVSTTERGRVPQAVTGVQHRRICALCSEARSIAEIAAYLDLPLNVVKVLVSDLDAAGMVLIHQSGLSFGDRSSREFMDRVLQGLRRL
ncbi:hypothetical protein GCM10022380_55650 [Amycolatopsis tucumanensis]|uniref:DUF742 domain-containing protein n=2 Tax=Pseudonocardiaceae TaxID=2070 RepID=A0ABP7IY78_9PSEU